MRTVGSPHSGGLAQLLTDAYPHRAFDRVAGWSPERISRRPDVVRSVIDRPTAVEVEPLLAATVGISVARTVEEVTGRLAIAVALTVPEADHAHHAAAQKRFRR